MYKYYYNGFRVDRPDGTQIYYTIQTRPFNSRPYALYVNGDQSSIKTYINRGALVNAVKRLAIDIKHNCPSYIITDICGAEKIR